MLFRSPGYDPDRELFLQKIDYPIVNINNEIKLYQDRFSGEILLEAGEEEQLAAIDLDWQKLQPLRELFNTVAPAPYPFYVIDLASYEIELSNTIAAQAGIKTGKK